MSTAFTDVKHVDENCILTVNGYIRTTQKILPNSSFYNITLLIQRIIIKYYWIGEYFEKCADNMKITGQNNETLIKERKQSYYNTAYGFNWIPSNSNSIIKWTLKVINSGAENSNTGVMIGLVANEVDMKYYRSIWRNPTADPTYFWCWSYIYHNGKPLQVKYGGHDDCSAYFGHTGSEVIMELNLFRKELIFYVDGKSYGVAAQNIKKDESIKYKLAICLYWPQTKIQITNFEWIHISKPI
eukprot:370912_1